MSTHHLLKVGVKQLYYSLKYSHAICLKLSVRAILEIFPENKKKLTLLFENKMQKQ